jgi:hypothetical protein
MPDVGQLNGYGNGAYLGQARPDRGGDWRSAPRFGDRTRADEFDDEEETVIISRQELVAIRAELDRRRPYLDYRHIEQSLSRQWRRSCFADLSGPEIGAKLFLWGGIIFTTVYGSAFVWLLIAGLVGRMMQ